MRTITGLVATVIATAMAIVVAPASLSATASAAAADRPECEGDLPGNQILRCLDLHYDAVNRRFRPHAGIQDNEGGADYDVDVYSVTVNTSTKHDPDGPFPVGDSATTSLQRCGDAGPRLVSYSAKVQWRNVATGAADSDLLRGGALVC